MKKIFALIISGLLIISCSKNSTSTNNIASNTTNANESIQVGESSINTNLKLIKPELAVRITPEQWRTKLMGENSKYSLGEMNTHNGVWLCLIHFSDDLKQSNIEECSQITEIKK